MEGRKGFPPKSKERGSSSFVPDWVFMASEDRHLSALARGEVSIQSNKASCHLLPHHHGPAPAPDPVPRVSQPHVSKGITSLAFSLFCILSFPFCITLSNLQLVSVLGLGFWFFVFSLAHNSRLYTSMFDYTQVTSFQLGRWRASAPTPLRIRKGKSCMMWG